MESPPFVHTRVRQPPLLSVVNVPPVQLAGKSLTCERHAEVFVVEFVWFVGSIVVPSHIGNVVLLAKPLSWTQVSPKQILGVVPFSNRLYISKYCALYVPGLSHAMMERVFVPLLQSTTRQPPT
jgi:hypothetical protein